MAAAPDQGLQRASIRKSCCGIVNQSRVSSRSRSTARCPPYAGYIAPQLAQRKKRRPPPVCAGVARRGRGLVGGDGRGGGLVWGEGGHQVAARQAGDRHAVPIAAGLAEPAISAKVQYCSGVQACPSTPCPRPLVMVAALRHAAALSEGALRRTRYDVCTFTICAPIRLAHLAQGNEAEVEAPERLKQPCAILRIIGKCKLGSHDGAVASAT